MLTTAAWIGALVIALVAFDRAALWAERRGWIYYRRRRAAPGTAAGAFLEMQSLLEPRTRHVIESKSDDAGESADAGDPPSPGTA